MDKCVRCDGYGKILCDRCNGEGKKYIKRQVMNDMFYKYEQEEISNCKSCLGIGSIKCTVCGGKGFI